MKKITFFVLINLFFSGLFAQTFEPLPSHITVNRELPIIDFPTTQTINISSYTAANDNGDDYQGIQKAIEDAIKASSASNPVRLVFERNGVYRINGTGWDAQALIAGNSIIGGPKNIIIDGQNCEWIMTNPKKAVMKIHRAENFIIKDVNIDYEPLPFTQGVVTAVDINDISFTWVKDEGFPDPNSSSVTGDMVWELLKDSSGNGALKNKAYNLWEGSQFSLISGNTYKVKVRNKAYARQVEVGDYYVRQSRKNDHGAFYTEFSKNVTFLRVNLYANIGAAFIATSNYELNIIDSNVKPKPGRVHSVNADGIHVSGSFRGPWVQGCEFSGFPDDGVNLKHQNIGASAGNAPNKLNLFFNSPLYTGDMVTIYNARNGVVRASNLTITQSDFDPGKFGTSVTLDGPHNSTSLGTSHNSDVVYAVSRSCQGFIFRNNVFQNNRSWGMIFQATQGQVKNNVFRNCSTGGLKLSNIPGWNPIEGLFPSYVEVDGNQFYNCGFDRESLTEYGKGAIIAKVSKIEGSQTSSGLFPEVSAGIQAIKNVWITNNYIEYNKVGMHLQDIDCLTLENNTIVHADDSYEQSDVFQTENYPQYINNVTFCNGQGVKGISVYPSQFRLTQVNKTFQPSATLIPVDTPNTTITWSSSNPSVATVNPSTGLITAIANGITTITATASGGYTDTCIITVGLAQPTDPIIHFMLDEPANFGRTVNTGQLSEIYGVITQGSTSTAITQGNNDPEKGVVLTSIGNNGPHIFLYDTFDSYPGPEGTKARTYSYWVKPRSVLNFNSIVLDGTGFDNIVIGYGQYGDLLFRHRNSNHLRTTEKLVLNQWNHVTFVLPENARFKDAKFYLNGVLCNVDTSAFDYNSSYNELIITPGRDQGSVFQVGSNFDGYLHDWRYYDYALTPEEIQNIFNPIALASLNVNPSSANMNPNENLQLNSIVNPSNASEPFVRWSSNNNEVATVHPITGVVTALGMGTAEITATSIDNPNIKAKSTIIVGTLSSNNTEVKNTIKIYPNPVNDVLNINVNAKYTNLTANIIDLSGRIILEKKLNNSTNNLNLNSVSEGVYILNLKDGDQLISIQKIVINH